MWFDFSQTNNIGYSPHNCARAYKWLHPEMFELIDSYVSQTPGHTRQQHKTNRADAFVRKVSDFDDKTLLMHTVRLGNYRQVLELYQNSTAEELARTDSHGKTAADYISEHNCSKDNIDIALLFGKTALAGRLRKKAIDAWYSKHENPY